MRQKTNIRSFPIQAFHKKKELVPIEKYVVKLSDRHDGLTKDVAYSSLRRRKQFVTEAVQYLGGALG